MTIILFGIIILIAHFFESVTGFSSTVIALPFCSMLVGVRTAVPALTALGLILSLYIIIIDFKHIVWKEYLRIIGFVGLGLPFGMIVFSYLSESTLKIILGLFMILVASRELYISYKKLICDKSLNKHILNLALFFGGILHGAFSAGGPFVVIYAAQVLKNKHNFRATLSTLWATLNTVIIIKNIYAGTFTMPAVSSFAQSIPFLAVGIILGNWAHHRVNETSFTKIVYIVLLITGFFMFI